MAYPADRAALPASVSGLAIDANGLTGLKAKAAQAPDKAMKLAAREFESLFLNQVLKSMRESLPKDGPFASQATESYTQMLDRELSKAMATKGTGLAAMIEKQLARVMTPPDAKPVAKSAQGGAPVGGAGIDPAAVSSAGVAAARAYAPAGKTSAIPAAAAPVAKSASTQDQRSFLARVMESAQAPASAAGLSPVFVAAQAALESGWGKREIKYPDGTSAHNLFGVKAGAGWSGATVDVTTTEYQNGAAVKKVEKFRAYDSYAEGLADYVKLLAGSARYKAAVAAGQDAKGFAQALARSGYATDPSYGDKLSRLIDKAKALTGQG
jgi:flagellar protein FlgJ